MHILRIDLPAVQPRHFFMYSLYYNFISMSFGDGSLPNVAIMPEGQVPVVYL